MREGKWPPVSFRFPPTLHHVNIDCRSAVKLPMNKKRETVTVRITIDIPEEIFKAAEARDRHIVEFVIELMNRGLESVAPRPSMNDAIERIRALHGKAIPTKDKGAKSEQAS